MFESAYLYYYLLAAFFAFIMLRASIRLNLSYCVYALYTWIGGVCSLACFAFLVLGFWFMPHWWYPLAIGGLSMIVSAFMPIPTSIGASIGIVAGPLFCVLMYLDLFNVIK